MVRTPILGENSVRARARIQAGVRAIVIIPFVSKMISSI